ncbi:MAG TPA: hypothetical protein VFU47_05610 [Armatimonadota bacterium]|nr:hypothetical protein [Armatimonadota bacterium]
MSSSRPSRIGIAGLVLALLSPLFCGLTALPGLLCCLVGIRRRAYPAVSWAGLVLSGSVLAFIGFTLYGGAGGELPAWTPDPLHRAYANGFLAPSRLPRLPESARDVRVAFHDRFFNASLLLRFRATRADAERFCAALGAAEKRRIDPARGALVLSSNTYAAKTERAPREGAGARPIVYRARGKAWFDPSSIRRGAAFTGTRGDERYELFYDEERATVYLDWSRS